MTTNRVKKTYTKEFKEEAVSLVLDQGYSVTEAANSLGVTSKVIYNWKQKIEAQKSGKFLFQLIHTHTYSARGSISAIMGVVCVIIWKGSS